LTPPHLIFNNSRVDSTTTNVLSFYGFNINSLLEKTIEQFSTRPRRPSVKSKSKLIQIIIQMRTMYSSLMGSQQPSLQQGSNSVCQGQQGFPYIGKFTYHNMLITFGSQTCVSAPIISAHSTSGFDVFLYKRNQICSRCIQHPLKANTSKMIFFIFNCDKNQRFTGCSTTSFSWPFPPIYVSSTSTTPDKRSRSGRTIAIRSLCSIIHMVSYL